MKKLFCMLCCAMLALSAVNCALAAEAGELATATSLKAYLPTVGWDDYTATDADGDGFDDEIMISYDANGHTDSDTIDIYCQCLDGAARVVSRLCSVPEDADPLKVYEQINEFNLNLSRGRWLYNEEDGYVYYTQGSIWWTKALLARTSSAICTLRLPTFIPSMTVSPRPFNEGRS